MTLAVAFWLCMRFPSLTMYRVPVDQRAGFTFCVPETNGDER